MTKPSEYAQKKRQQDTGDLRVRDWYNDPDCDSVARRRQVWGLLMWYHHNVARPNQGIGGVCRRLYWRVRGWFQPEYRLKLLSPWEQLALRMRQLAAMEMARQQARQAEDRVELPPEEGNGRGPIEVVKD